MKIERENYEPWFLDYLEGRLDQEGREEVHNFLLKHPDLADELESFSPGLSIDADLKYPGKDLLKKTQFDDSGIFENMAVAEMEGDLTEEESSAFNDWLSKYPEKQVYMSEIRQIRLEPDASMVFPHKGSLKKRQVYFPMLLRITAAAALLLIAFLLFYPSGQQSESLQLSVNNNISAEKREKPTPENVKKITGLTKEKEINHVRISQVAQQPNKKSRQAAETQLAEARVAEKIGSLQARTIFVQTDLPAYYDLMPVRIDPVNYASVEIPLSEYLGNKLQSLKDQGQKGFLTREEFAVAGLRLFSRLPGNHLTGKKGKDGKLKSITFSSQPLAISIPINN